MKWWIVSVFMAVMVIQGSLVRDAHASTYQPATIVTDIVVEESGVRGPVEVSSNASVDELNRQRLALDLGNEGMLKILWRLPIDTQLNLSRGDSIYVQLSAFPGVGLRYKLALWKDGRLLLAAFYSYGKHPLSSSISVPGQLSQDLPVFEAQQALSHRQLRGENEYMKAYRVPITFQWQESPNAPLKPGYEVQQMTTAGKVQTITLLGEPYHFLGVVSDQAEFVGDDPGPYYEKPAYELGYWLIADGDR